MPVIKLSAFAGEKPLINPRLLPETASKAAFNVRLNDGALTPINKTIATGTLLPAGHKTLFRHQGGWLSWAGEVNAVPGPVAEDRLYYTGEGVPKMRVNGVVYNLATPRPTAALATAISGAGTGDIQTRGYVYTHVSTFDEETAPSPVSTLIDWMPGQTVTLSGFQAPAAGRSFDRQRIYRSQSSSSGTALYFIAERATSTANFVDNIAVDAFQEPLPSADWNAVPDGLSGLISMPNGMMAAFVGRSVYFCEAYRPHAWPEKYIMSCDTEIVGLRAIGTSLIVMTKGQPYLMSGSTPDSIQSLKLEANFPCINSRAIVDLGFAICYPSNLGLIAIRADGTVTLATQELFDRTDWEAMSPATAMASQHAGSYVMFYSVTSPSGETNSGSLFINVAAAQYLVRSGASATAAFYSLEDEGMYFMAAGDQNVYRFDAPAGAPETLYWKSKEFWTATPINFGAIRIDSDTSRRVKTQGNIDAERQRIITANQAILASPMLGSELDGSALGGLAFNGDTLQEMPGYDEILVNIYADRELVCSISKTNQVARLPAKRTANVWELDVASNVQITQILIAGTVDELRMSG